MPVVWSAGAPNLVLKGISAQLQSQICLSPGLVGFVGVAEVSATVGYRGAVVAAVGYRRAGRLRRSAHRSRPFPRPRPRLRRPEATHTSDHSSRTLLGIRHRRRHTRADHVTELTMTLSSAPMTLGGVASGRKCRPQPLPAAELVRAQQHHKSGAALEHNVTNPPSKCPSIRPVPTLGRCAAPLR